MRAVFMRCRCARSARSSRRSSSSNGVRLITYTLGTRVIGVPSDRRAQAGAVECRVQHSSRGEGIPDGTRACYRTEEFEAGTTTAGKDQGVDSRERRERVGERIAKNELAVAYLVQRSHRPIVNRLLEQPPCQ